MSHLNINIHLFYNDENKVLPNDISKIEQTIWEDIKNKANKKGITLDFLYGTSNQCFCVIVLKKDQTIQQVMNKIPMKRSFFINNKGISNKFNSPQLATIFNSQNNNEQNWTVDIYLIHVSESVFDRISNYNRIQLQIETKKTSKVNDAYVVQYSFDKKI